MAEWQPIETAPTETWAEALLWDGYAVASGYIHPDGFWVRTNLGPEDEDSELTPTHWLPMPEGPK